MVRSSSHVAGVTTLSVEKDELPEWLHEKLKVERDEVCQMEVSIQSHEQYNALVGYLACRAVDVNERAPRWCERIHSVNGDGDSRPFPGKLSSLQMQPVDPWEWTDDSSSDSESDDSDSDEEEEEEGPTLGIGFGWGKVKTNPVRSDEHSAFYQGEADVFFHHFAMGDPMVVMDDALVLYKVIVLYAASTKIVQKLCREALEWVAARDEAEEAVKPEKYEFYKCKVGEDKDWVYHGKLRSRPMSSIILAPGMENAINLDCELFLVEDRKKWYHEHGLTYKRTYLFHGPANTGKKSVVYALAGLYNRKVCMLDVSSDNLTEAALQEALSSLPKHCILVVENVDSSASLAFENLLAAFEAMVSKDGLITVLTAKDVTQFQPALLRLGRVDRRFEFREPGTDEIVRYFSSFYPGAGTSVASKFAEHVLQRPEAEAKHFTTLAQFFIFCAGEPASSACEKLDEFFQAFFPAANEPAPMPSTAPRVHRV